MVYSVVADNETLIHLKYIREVVCEMKASIQKLETVVQRQNGRVRSMEIAVAVLKWGFGVIGAVSLYLFVEFVGGML
jgi:hypothetical protein|tara:strand:- start:1534 stop:1764 length:231 start_codon:yes stop_codon:yes gene_type:complete